MFRDNLLFRRALRRSHQIAKQGRREMVRSTRAAKLAEELPASSLGRLELRASRTASVVGSVATIATSCVAIRAAWLELRKQPEPNTNPTLEQEEGDE